MLLSKMAYFLYHILFLTKRIGTSRKIIMLPEQDALEKINQVYPKPLSTPVVVDPEINSSLDLSIVVPVYNHHINTN